jgi:hypothetical protein
VTLAFVTGALAAGMAAAGLSTLIVWIVTVVTGSGDAWAVAPGLVVAISAAVGIATYIAERIVYRRSESRKRATGEPWAYRED